MNHGASSLVVPKPDDGFGKDEGLIHEAVITGRKVGAGKEFWSALAHNDRLFEKTVRFVACGGRTEPTPHRVAELIMGENFRSIAETFRALNRQITEREFRALETIPYPEETLVAHRSVSILRPEFETTLTEFSASAPNAMCGTNNWYRAWGGEAFAQSEKTSVRWRLVPKESVPGSLGKGYDEQAALASPGQEIMSAVEWVFTLALEASLKRDRAFLEYWNWHWGRTKSLDDEKFRVSACLRDGRTYLSYRLNDLPHARTGIVVSFS